MTTSNKRLHMIAIKMLEHVGDDIRDIDCEIDILSREIEMMVIKKEDAKWAGHNAAVNSLRYQLMIKNIMRNMLNKLRVKLIREMK